MEKLLIITKVQDKQIATIPAEKVLSYLNEMINAQDYRINELVNSEEMLKALIGRVYAFINYVNEELQELEKK